MRGRIINVAVKHVPHHEKYCMLSEEFGFSYECYFVGVVKRCLTLLIMRETQIKTTMRYHSTLVRMAIIKKSANNKCWRGCGEKRILLHCWQECKSIQPLWKTVWRFLKKLGIKPPYDPAIPLLGIYPEETKIEKNTYIPLFIAALFTIARTWKQPRCPVTDEWIKQLWYSIYTM